MNRLPFGVASAASKFQKYIEQTLRGIEGCATYLDDVIVTEKNKRSHLETLEKVLVRLQNAGLTLKIGKCKFFAPKITYLGHKISKNGLIKTNDKVEAILKAPTPENIGEVRSMLGCITFYSKFIPNMSTILSPIYNLLKKETKFTWTESCEAALKKIKDIIASDIVLTHFDPNLPIFLTTDSSDLGIAAVLSHRMPDGLEKPISFIFRTLLPAEQKYSTIHKEALGIFWAVLKRHNWQDVSLF